ncbi:N-acetylmuramoyl-L-alanine amidase [Prevotella sp. P5-92]|uniref:N-acetylmuramoyl-L-alanine amidase family protein n=1 Tax=Prevotella sp. P5-92 TaxID=2024222 RepID=UPI000B95FFE7|nr:N-acetylmuramoyl-L-alanine amidase [Prevotella sp. P5-92]OYP57559.1 N-acetylmuramoyl-L-alanine amidase [Prevotella sp. P5-92]
MGKKIVLAVLFLITQGLVVAAQNKKFTLVIDAGHGGHDAGALGASSKEKNINLNVALAFGNYVERNCPDVKVVYTRKTDVFVTLHERANIANRHKADLFVSIHTNALPAGKQARGLETYTLGMNRANENFDVAKRENAVILYEKDYEQHYEGFDPNSSESYIMFEFMQDKNMAQSVDLAKMVQKRACSSANRQNKGVKQAGFLVLRETSMPSCLIELGFITTPQEEQQLNTRECIDALGYGIFQAFVDYRNKYDKTIIVPFEAPERQVMENQAQERVQKESEGGKTQTAEQEKDNVPRSESKMVNEVPEQKPATDSEAPIFKIQVLTSTTLIRQGDKRLKGLDGVDYYKDGGIYKYTIGASANYNEIYRLRKTMVGKFPQAFIIAFKGGQRTDVVEAIKEFKRNKNR